MSKQRCIKLPSPTLVGKSNQAVWEEKWERREGEGKQARGREEVRRGGEKGKGIKKEGKGKREWKREVKEKRIGRKAIKLKNGRVGKEIKLVTTLYTL